AGLERELDARLALGASAKGHVPQDSGVVPPGDAWPTVYLGGGTPSLLGPDGLRALGEFIARRFPGAGGEEYTVEVNPEHADRALYAAVRSIGGTRVSLGVQTLDPAGLGALGRAHDAATAKTALICALEAELAVSADLIVGWPGQSNEALAADVTQLVDLGVRHVSVYALTIESGTPWETLVRRGKRRLPDPDHQADMLLAAEAALTGAGLEHYEVASYAAPGERARHNLGYWTWQDYLGLGPSAHSAVYAADGSVTRRGNLRGLPAWQADPATPAEIDPQDPTAAAAEGLWTGLRHLPGLDLAAFLARFPAVDRAWIEGRTRKQVARGNLELAGGVLRVAAGRWMWHDAIAADLLA
ncbi:MAG TPA: coproporphyrinogen-III oxidase family protein, partial [Nannocystis sp.]